MKLFSCLEPKHVVNPYTGEDLIVPCGKCHACRNSHATSWAERLEVERRCWKYTFFVTLTYSDAMVPRYYFKHGCLYEDPNYEVFVCDLEDTQRLSDNDYSFLTLACSITHHSSCHIKEFIKRLRSKVNYYDHENKVVRYYCISEYGPKTFRAHYHLLLFTNSSWFANSHKEVISSCWSTDNRTEGSVPYGMVDSQLVTSGAASYVAGYVSCVADLPIFYSHPALRPKIFCSRRPPLGSLLINSFEVEQLYKSASPVMLVYSQLQSKAVTVPISSSLRNRLWPKIRGFDTNGFDLNVKLYELGQTLVYSSYGEFESACHALYEKLYATDLGQYLYKLHESKPTSFVRFYSCVRRVCMQSVIFGVSVKEYVRQMSLYYTNCETYNYKQYCSFVDENISLGIDKRQYIFTDLVKVDKLAKSVMNHTLSDSDRIILESYGYDSDVLDCIDLTYDFTSEYLSLSHTHKELHTKALKKRVKNESELTPCLGSISKLINFFYG